MARSPIGRIVYKFDANYVANGHTAWTSGAADVGHTVANTDVFDPAGDSRIFRGLVLLFHSFERFPQPERLIENLPGRERIARFQDVPVTDIISIDADSLRQAIKSR